MYHFSPKREREREREDGEGDREREGESRKEYDRPTSSGEQAPAAYMISWKQPGHREIWFRGNAERERERERKQSGSRQATSSIKFNVFRYNAIHVPPPPPPQTRHSIIFLDTLIRMYRPVVKCCHIIVDTCWASA